MDLFYCTNLFNLSKIKKKKRDKLSFKFIFLKMDCD